MYCNMYRNMFVLTALLLMWFPYEGEGYQHILDSNFNSNLAVPSKYWQNSDILETLAQIHKNRYIKRQGVQNGEDQPGSVLPPTKPDDADCLGYNCNKTKRIPLSNLRDWYTGKCGSSLRYGTRGTGFW